MDITVRYTERANHAKEICAKDLKPGDYDCVVAISGDGLIHEIVNGFCHRADWTSDLKDSMTIGFIPGGTGNALASSVLKHTNENYGVQEAAFLVAKGRRMFMDITELDGEYEDRKIYSFLSTAWAIIGDCDINSEAIRWAGSIRFTLWGVMRVLFMQRYMGCFNFNGFYVKNKKDIPENDLIPVEMPVLQKHAVTNNWFLHFFAGNTPWISSDMHYLPLSRLNDGMNDIIYQK